MNLDYHAKAFELIGHTAEPIQHDFLAAFSAGSGLAMPPSVEEFFAVRDAVDLLGNFSNRDHALLPEEFEVTEVNAVPGVCFLVENQACCRWAFLLDGSNDPPVWVDESGSDESPLWNATQVSFSTFIYLRFFDFQYFDRTLELDRADDCHLDTEVVPRAALDELARCFRMAPSNYDWPRAGKYWFWRDNQRILIYALSDCAQWHLFAPTIESHEALVGEIRGFIEEHQLWLQKI